MMLEMTREQVGLLINLIEKEETSKKASYYRILTQSGERAAALVEEGEKLAQLRTYLQGRFSG